MSSTPQPEVIPQASNSTRFPPALAITFAILAVSTAAIFIRFAQAEAPSLVIAAYRLGISALFLVPVALVHRRSEFRQLGRRQWLLTGLSGLLLAFHFASWITSLEYTTVASSVVLVTTTPLWVALFSPVFLRERMTPALRMGMGVALVGGTLVGISEACQLSSAGLSCAGFGSFFDGQAFLGNFLALVGAWMAAGYLMIGRRLRAGMSLLVYTSLVYSVSALALLVMTILARQPLLGYSRNTMLWFLALAVIPQLLGHSTFNWALKHVPAGFVSVFLLGEPIGSTILAFFLLREIPGPLEILGGMVILVGIWLISR